MGEVEKGFGYITGDIFSENENITQGMILVYTYLCFINGKDEYCYPSQSRIAKATRKDRASVSRDLKKLEEAGFIKIVPQFDKKGGQKTNHYYILKGINSLNGVLSEHRGCVDTTQGGCSQNTGGVLSEHTTNTNYQYQLPQTNNSCCNSKNVEERNKQNPIHATTTTVIDKINSICGTRYRVTKRVRDMIRNLINSNYTIEDLNLVIDVKVKEFVEKGKLAMTKPGNLFGSIERFDELLQEASNNQMKVYSSSYTNDKKEKKVIRPEWEENSNKSYTEPTEEEKEEMLKQLEKVRSKGAKESE